MFVQGGWPRLHGRRRHAYELFHQKGDVSLRPVKRIGVVDPTSLDSCARRVRVAHEGAIEMGRAVAPPSPTRPVRPWRCRLPQHQWRAVAAEQGARSTSSPTATSRRRHLQGPCRDGERSVRRHRGPTVAGFATGAEKPLDLSGRVSRCRCSSAGTIDQALQAGRSATMPPDRPSVPHEVRRGGGACRSERCLFASSKVPR